ncbi:MAG: type II secretory pathway pseudopilin PulG [Rhodothermales bacterium]|jgi:type II secretory pathway pseudopilin PulG
MRKRFTLLELLLVISVIAILAAMLFGAIAAVKRRAMNVESKAKITQLLLAINSYQTAYNTLPLAGTIASDRPLTPSEYNTLLRCLMADPARPELNPRREKFLQNQQELCRDAWAQDFIITMDYDYDGQIADSAIHGYDTGDLSTQIAIWSKGRDRADNPIDTAHDNRDNVTSWQR